MSSTRISNLRPADDESLISFVRRSQAASIHTRGEVQALVGGASFADARRAERRAFDWTALSRVFNATADELFRMSERALHCSKSDHRRIVCTRFTPWMSEKGYSAHCPTCLSESAHWRKNWMQPGAAVCSRHSLLLVDHCHVCGVDLSTCTWSNTVPWCPKCGSHLALNTRFKPSGAVIDYAARCAREFDELTREEGWSPSGRAWSKFGAWWHVAQLFLVDRSETIASLGRLITSLAGLECERDESRLPGTRRAWCFVMAMAVLDLDSGFEGFYRDSVLNGARGSAARNIVRFRMFELASRFGIKAVPESPWNVQTLMAFSNDSESNAEPIAA
jgi:hypothetical protein